MHVASASSNWPILRHMLPEIAFAGHSNCGKSTLVNSMVGVLPKKGPAKISNRAGWTDQICFYQVCLDFQSCLFVSILTLFLALNSASPNSHLYSYRIS